MVSARERQHDSNSQKEAAGQSVVPVSIVSGQRTVTRSRRIDTLQLGLAPYKHDYAGLATWVALQGRRYSAQNPSRHGVGAAAVQTWRMG